MLYKIVKVIITILTHIIYRFEVTGKENIPETGRFLLCANHIHAFDPVVVAVFSRRQPRFMAKKEVFNNALFGAFLRAIGAFPVDRGTTDMQAFRKSMEILNNDHGMLIFAQGTRMEGFEDAKRGVALFALKSGAPIIPIGIRGNYRIFSKIRINIGNAISMDKYQGQKIKSELIDEVMEMVTESVTKQCM